MEIIDLFKQCVAKITLNENLTLLSKFCLKIKKQQKGRNISNIGGFQSENIELNSKEIKNLCNNITLHANEYFKNILKNKKNIFLDSLWVNVNNYKDFNMMHEHPFSKISGVFYVKTPKNCGNIVFISDSKILSYLYPDSMTEFNNYNASRFYLQSMENVLYLFPSWLNHYVEPNLSNKDRISISFNLN